MMMCGQSNPLWHYAAGRWPGRVGLLLGPSYFKKQAIRQWLPYALDNDAFSAWTSGKPWSESAWLDMLQWSRMVQWRPLWALVPDVVANREATLERWEQYSGLVEKAGFCKAFAVQDGMSALDVPKNADVVFVGGTNRFKWGTVKMWSDSFERIHVGRVNNAEKVWLCEDLGVESVDGTGWFRDPSDPTKLPALMDWLEGTRNEIDELTLA